MGSYIVEGGHPIGGEMEVCGSKNAVLPLLAAAILAEDEVVFENCPKIGDVFLMLEILAELGCSHSFSGNTLVIDSRDLKGAEIGSEGVGRIRSSVLFLGALLGREKKAVLGHPGGCSIGKRPIDLHLKAFEKMGVVIRERDGLFHCTASDLHGAEIFLEFPSVGATENILLLAVRAEGATLIRNAAKEPEVAALAEFLRACGGEIYGEGTDTILIEGKSRLHGACFSVPADRIVGGTYLIGAAMTGGELLLKGLEREHMSPLLPVLEQTGCFFRWNKRELWMRPPKKLRSGFTITTAPFPAFPTDLQPQMLALLTLAEGTGMMMETVFEARFAHAFELCRMGADICIQGRKASVTGVEKLHGAEVYGKDLRGGAALLLAALAAEGESIVHGTEFMERGYEDIGAAFSFLGGKLEKAPEGSR